MLIFRAYKSTKKNNRIKPPEKPPEQPPNNHQTKTPEQPPERPADEKMKKSTGIFCSSLYARFLRLLK
jgi:hypothetical protein